MCIHRMKIVHRDLKSANCLVNKHWTVKICDFGLSRVMIDSPMTDNSSAGTPEWMAPELIRNEPFTEKCDIFSLGVIMWELCTLSRPWEGISPVQVIIHPLFYRYSCSMHARPKGVCWLKHVVHFNPLPKYAVLLAQSLRPLLKCLSDAFIFSNVLVVGKAVYWQMVWAITGGVRSC